MTSPRPPTAKTNGYADLPQKGGVAAHRMEETITPSIVA
jgi:hypothetical protein